MPDGIEVVHSQSLDSKATGWVWQFAIFAAGALPAAGMIAYVKWLKTGRMLSGLANPRCAAARA
jgi:hypothetical protein